MREAWRGRPSCCTSRGRRTNRSRGGSRLGVMLGVVVVTGSLHAVWGAWRAAAVTTAAWRSAAQPAATGTLIVDRGLATAAVAGMWRPTVFVGRALADRLTPSEFRAVLAHEWAHARAGDNVKRALLLGAPDLLRFTSRGAGLITAWMVATEHAADDRVARLGRDAALDLASALVKAARIAAVPTVEPALVRSMSEHGEVSGRVVRLLDELVGRWRVTSRGAAGGGWCGGASGPRLGAGTCRLRGDSRRLGGPRQRQAVVAGSFTRPRAPRAAAAHPRERSTPRSGRPRAAR